ncbi:unnamed protein product, partial [Ectocarpus sp. 4 AP-2014]
IVGSALGGKSISRSPVETGDGEEPEVAATSSGNPDFLTAGGTKPSNRYERPSNENS